MGAEKSNEVIELLELDKGDMRVAQYLTAMPPKNWKKNCVWQSKEQKYN